jgi:hypothetical protein
VPASIGRNAGVPRPRTSLGRVVMRRDARPVGEDDRAGPGRRAREARRPAWRQGAPLPSMPGPRPARVVVCTCMVRLPVQPLGSQREPTPARTVVWVLMVLRQGRCPGPCRPGRGCRPSSRPRFRWMWRGRGFIRRRRGGPAPLRPPRGRRCGCAWESSFRSTACRWGRSSSPRRRRLRSVSPSIAPLVV